MCLSACLRLFVRLCVLLRVNVFCGSSDGSCVFVSLFARVFVFLFVCVLDWLLVRRIFLVCVLVCSFVLVVCLRVCSFR